MAGLVNCKMWSGLNNFLLNKKIFNDMGNLPLKGSSRSFTHGSICLFTCFTGSVISNGNIDSIEFDNEHEIQKITVAKLLQLLANFLNCIIYQTI